MSLYRNCESVTRRDCLRLGVGALLGGGLIDNLRLRGLAGAADTARPKTSCILIWMDGGPSHYETFDPKPDAPKEIRGDFKAIATKVPGIQFAEPMTKLAGIADKLAIVRSIQLATYCPSIHVHNASTAETLLTAPPADTLAYNVSALVRARPTLYWMMITSSDPARSL